MAGETVLARVVVGEFEERLEAKMSVSSSEVARVRALKSNPSDFEAYAVELNALIEIGPTDVDADLDAVDAAFSIVSLRRRLTALEQRVRELEAHK